MNSLNFLDTNVWLALVWERHSHAELARKWFTQCEDERFLFCRFTQLALLRLLTTNAVMGEQVRSMTGAWEVYDRCCADERIALLPEPDGLDPRFRALAKSRQPSPNVWADAYLAAFASAAGLKLVTFDKALRSRAAECLVLG
jgi:toxin-antitoxin system PIN domain toxin